MICYALVRKSIVLICISFNNIGNIILICILFLDAVRKEKKFNSTPDHEISTVVAKWLAQAPNRISKKKKATQLKAQSYNHS